MIFYSLRTAFGWLFLCKDVFEVAFDSSMKVRLQHRPAAATRSVVDVKSGSDQKNLPARSPKKALSKAFQRCVLQLFLIIFPFRFNLF